MSESRSPTLAPAGWPDRSAPPEVPEVLEILRAGQEALDRAREIAQRITERVNQTVGRDDVPGPPAG
jgi:hypothetical protein